MWKAGSRKRQLGHNPAAHHTTKPSRDRRRDDDGTILDAPSLKRVDTSVDSDLGSLRDAVKMLVNSRENANRIQTTSGESVIGEDMSENVGLSTTDTGFLVEKAEEAANEMQKDDLRQNSNETITTEIEYKREPPEMAKRGQTSSKKFRGDTRSIKKPLAGSKEIPLEKSDLNMATCKTQLSAKTTTSLKSSTAAKRKKKGKTTSSEIIACSSSKVTPSNSREASFQDEPKRKEDRPLSLKRR
ncbi:hypothetical protein COOONC_06154 [Cooperia oncophora]